IVKGAPESVIRRCLMYESEGSTMPFPAGQETACLQTFHELSDDGYRVLAVAYRNIEHRDAYSADDESALVLAGYLAFADPPRPDTARTVAALRQDGVRLKILTGDNEFVTRHVCEQVGIDTSGVVLGG